MTNYLGLAVVNGRLLNYWQDGTLLPAFVGASDDNSRVVPDFLDEPSAANFLHVPLGRLRKWRKEGRVAYHKPTHQTVLYDRRDLIALMEATRVEATIEPPAPRSRPKSDAHKRAIAEGQRKAWERRRAKAAR